MSKRTDDFGLFGRTAPPAMLMVVALVATLAFAVARPAAALAQGTPEASPAAGPCDAPDLPPGTPTPMEEGTPAGMPEMEMGTPEAGAAEATPEPTAAPAGTPADEATTDEVTAAAQNLANCLGAGDFEGAAALISPNLQLLISGTDNPYDTVAALEGFQPDVQALRDAQTHEDGRVSIVIDYLDGHQLISERWYFVREGDRLLLDDFVEVVAQPEGDTTAFGVTLTEYAFELNLDTVTATDVLIIHATNAGVEPHEIVLVKFPEGVEFSPEMLESEEPPEGTEEIGFIFLEPGQEGDMVLIDLEPGVYTLLCFIPAADGEPHVAKGMVATLTIEAPAA